MNRLLPTVRLSSSAALLAGLLTLSVPVACAQSVAPIATQETAMASVHPNSIQPETTLAISASGEVMVAPDIAFVSLGVQSEAITAEGAMSENAAAMNGVFAALREAGLEDRDIQTSNFSLQPVYDYVEREDGRGGEQVLRGYRVSNQVTAKVSDLDNLGATLDAVVTSGGNTFNGVRFAVEDDRAIRDDARRRALQSAIARAELYADVAGYTVSRIVTIDEHGSRQGPQPMMEMAVARAAAMDSPTPIAGGEVGFTMHVNVTFELVK
ncbi:MAG: SIMPL domain-containing protein [Pseudomonadota bacterium]